MSDVIKNRYDFELFFDVTNGNPNGDPDAGNMPRIDPETGHGIVTGECIRRKIRNYIDIVKAGDPDYGIYIKNDAALNKKDDEAFRQFGIACASDLDSKNLKKELTDRKKDGLAVDDLVREFMCRHYYDVRTFGAVITTAMTTKLNCGQIKGPVQMDMAESIDPVIPREITLTRMAITKESDREKKINEMANKYIIPYGLYCMKGHISANTAEKTGFTEDDMKLFWTAVGQMFEEDHSSQRGEMALQKIIVFRHDSMLGEAPAHKLFQLVHVDRKPEVEVARSFSDYVVTIDKDKIPDGVTLETYD